MRAMLALKAVPVGYCNRVAESYRVCGAAR